MTLIIEDNRYGGQVEFELGSDRSYDENELRNWYDSEIDDMYISFEDLEELISSSSGEQNFGDCYFGYID